MSDGCDQWGEEEVVSDTKEYEGGDWYSVEGERERAHVDCLDWLTAGVWLDLLLTTTTKSPPPGVGARGEETDRRCQTDSPHVSLTSLSVYMGFRFWGSIRAWQWCCRSNVNLEAADSLCSSYSWRNFSMTKTFVRRQTVGWWVVSSLHIISHQHIQVTISIYNLIYTLELLSNFKSDRRQH